MDEEKLKTFLGTESYMAPEINLKLKYDGKAVDLFAAAIVLFIMYSGTPPFGRAFPADPYYKLLCTKKERTFWAAHSRNKPGRGKYYSKSFKDFLTKMLNFEPAKRLSMEQVLEHPWFNEDVPSEKEVIQEFSQRKARVDEEHEKERQAKIRAMQRQKAKENLQMQGAGAY